MAMVVTDRRGGGSGQCFDQVHDVQSGVLSA